MRACQYNGRAHVSEGPVSFKYDPFGRRIYKSSSSGTSIYAYDGPNVAEETNVAGSAVARYVHDRRIDEPLAMLRGVATNYYQADGLGSVTSLSNTSGALAQTYAFDSFGNPTVSSGSLTNAFRFTGREFDAETNLYYYRARYYDPSAGRFIAEDPGGFNAGVHFYKYVKNQPLDYIDPYGLKCQQVTPWQEIPQMRGAPLQPYLTVRDGVFWDFQGWDFSGGPEGPVISCICDWIASRTRIRKYYEKNVTEEAWFECTDCKGSHREHQTRNKFKKWEVDTPGGPIIPYMKAQTTGATVQLGARNVGMNPDASNTDCTCQPPAP
jgi:RHS repeat-associated protein